MTRLKGQPVSPGYALGRAYIYHKRKKISIPKKDINHQDVPCEHERLHSALEKSVSELKNLEKKVLAELGRAESQIFASHLALLKDEKFINKVKARISDNLVNVEHALEHEVDDLSSLLSDVEDEYLRERAKDVQDVGRRVLKHLGHRSEEALYNLPANSILVAEELLPSDTLNLDRKNVSAIITERGGNTSHMAILARSLGIPAVTGITDACSVIAQNAEVMVDGEEGIVTVNPEKPELTEFKSTKNDFSNFNFQLFTEENLECKTKDGTEITLKANIARPYEVKDVKTHHLHGIGLFRTEYLFLNSYKPPTIDDQIEIYKQVAEELDGLPVTVRTLDLGGDKQPMFLEHSFEKNPNLGVRGLRFSLMERNLFETQLKAILTAYNDCPNIQILFPMVMGEEDLSEAKAKVKEIADNLKLSKLPDIGAMIETPSALFELEQIVNVADFLSIGTNDLSQFMLAADRNSLDLVTEKTVLHPSVLRAIKKVVKSVSGKNLPVSICGESAGNPAIACLIIGLGVRQLSMSPARTPQVNYAIRRQSLVEIQNIAEEALNCHRLKEVEKVLDKINVFRGVKANGGKKQKNKFRQKA